MLLNSDTIVIEATAQVAQDFHMLAEVTPQEIALFHQTLPQASRNKSTRHARRITFHPMTDLAQWRTSDGEAQHHIPSANRKSLAFVGVDHTKRKPVAIVGVFKFSDQAAQPFCKLVADAAHLRR